MTLSNLSEPTPLASAIFSKSSPNEIFALQEDKVSPSYDPGHNQWNVSKNGPKNCVALLHRIKREEAEAVTKQQVAISQNLTKSTNHVFKAGGENTPIAVA